MFRSDFEKPTRIAFLNPLLLSTVKQLSLLHSPILPVIDLNMCLINTGLGNVAFNLPDEKHAFALSIEPNHLPEFEPGNRSSWSIDNSLVSTTGSMAI